MADTPIPERLMEEVAKIYNTMEFDDLELQEMVMLAIAQGILAERAAQAERIRELEEALRNLAHEMRLLLRNNQKMDGGLYRQRLHEADTALGGNNG
jgi:hypothetical protein